MQLCDYNGALQFLSFGKGGAEARAFFDASLQLATSDPTYIRSKPSTAAEARIAATCEPSPNWIYIVPRSRYGATDCWLGGDHDFIFS
jgi:hypothetical protein